MKYNMIRNYYNEIWKDIVFDDKISTEMTFKISNHGRLIKVVNGEDVLIEKQYSINGYYKDKECTKEDLSINYCKNI